MAAPPQVPTVPNTPLLNRYDGHTNGNTRLPSGPCNYTNLSIGGDAKCGCQRFTELEGSRELKSGICFCEHHSCFHDHHPVNASRVLSDASAAGGLSLTPRASAYRQSPMQRDHDMQDEQPEVGLPKGEPMSDTLHWSRFVKSGSSRGSIPAIPSQCLLPSDDGSRASSSQAGFMRPFGGLGLNTLSHIPRAGSLNQVKGQQPGKERQMQLCEDSHGNQFLQSLTEAATPSVYSQNLDAGIAFGKNVAKVQNALQRISEERSQGTVVSRRDDDQFRSGSSVALQREENTEYLLPRIRSMLDHVADHPMKIQNHEQRLDHLENASFTHHPAIDEMQENHSYLETRVDSLETRVDELEKLRIAQSDTASFASRHNLEGSVDTTTSSALIAAAIDRVDSSRIETLEAQISELQAAAPPSHARPWEFEVVFLPYGPRLNGIWSSHHPPTQRSRMSSTAGEDGTQSNAMALAHASLTANDAGVAWDSVMKYGADQCSPLMPRACGLRSIIGERLKSRGFVRSIQVKGPDARDVQAAMLAAFGDLPSTLANESFPPQSENREAIPAALTSYLGLRASWVPLRKVHKDDILQFLNASEMITPALWNVHFLSSSVAMRAQGVRRLYVTQADSYIQHLRNEPVDWTWQKLRELPRVYSDAPSSINHTPEADAHEPCWEIDDRLDPPLSFHSSFTSSHHSALSIRPCSFEHQQDIDQASPSDSSTPPSPATSTTPTSIIPQPFPPISPLAERHFRPLHTRTSSMPTLVPLSSPSMTKRRIASFELDSQAQSSPTRSTAITAVLKRRRISRSPSRPRDTPRWSVGPPSPYGFVDEMGADGRKRGTTPFAYATPHSNAPYMEGGRYADGDYEDEGSVTDEIEDGEEERALSDYSDEEEEDQLGTGQGRADEEWEGVQDDESRDTHTLSGKTAGRVKYSHDEAEADEDMRSEASDASSSPSEYPSRQPDAFSETKAGFRIHVDEEIGGGY